MDCHTAHALIAASACYLGEVDGRRWKHHTVCADQEFPTSHQYEHPPIRGPRNVHRSTGDIRYRVISIVWLLLRGMNADRG